MLINLLGMIFANTVIVLCIYRLNNETINLKDKKLYFSIIFYNLLTIMIVNINLRYLQTFMNYFGLFIVTMVVLNKSLINSLLTALTIYLLIILLELVIYCPTILIFDAYSRGIFIEIMNLFHYNLFFSFILNLVVSIIVFTLCGNKVVKKIYNSFKKLIEIFDLKIISYVLSIIIMIVIIAYAVIFYSANILITLLTFFILLTMTGYIFVKNIKTRLEYEETKEKYSSVQQSLLEYEDMIDKYRVNNHENKNQLLTIQHMLKSKDKKVRDYIDNLVGNVYMTNEKMLMDVSVIPSGGLRATIHSKLNIMDNTGIKYLLNIDRKLRMVDFESINSQLNLKICKIVSIFIDNAIDEVSTHDEEKIVNIEMYLSDNNLIIEISNRFKNKFDIDKIDEKRYTTKKEGHGYGLSLAKELTDSEIVLENYRRIENDVFTQQLLIKLKK